MAKIAKVAEFIGRNDELNKLSTLLEKASNGKGQIIFISGEAGIGKTRLINEVRKKPIGKSFTWLTARCIFSEGTDPYLPFKDALKEWKDRHNNTIPGVEPVGSTVDLKDSKAINLKDIPAIGEHLAQEPAVPFGAFMLKEPKAEHSIAAFTALMERGHNGICISRIPHDKLGSAGKYKRARYLWLTKKPGKDYIPPSLTKISHEVTTYIKENANSVVVLDGLEYVIGNMEFNKVLRFINELVDSTALYKSILIIPVNPGAIERKQLALLERDMSVIDLMTDSLTRKSEPGRTVGVAPVPSKLTEEELQQGRDQVFETLTQQILDIASQKPVILVIDDLHWADVGGLNLLHYLARAIENQPVAIFGSYRPEDLAVSADTHPFMTFLNRLTQEKLIKQVSLERFKKDEAGEMINSLLEESRFPNELIEFVFNETEGNAFYIEEVIRSLEEEAVISFDESKTSWVLTRNLPEISLPDTIKDVVNARTDRLNKAVRIVLESASVLGAEFEYDILAAASAHDEHQLVTQIDDLLRLKFILELPSLPGQPIRYKFAHHKIREVLYEGLGQSRKRLLHIKTADALEKRYANNIEPALYELADHCYRGTDFGRCMHYAVRAAEKALGGYAPEKARMFYQWALDSIEFVEAPPSEQLSHKKQKAEIITKLAELDILLGEWNRALENAGKLQELSDNLNDVLKKIEAYNFSGRIHSLKSEWADAITKFNKGLELAVKSNYQAGLMEAYHGLGVVHSRKGEFDRAMDYYQNFMELARASDSPNQIARGYKAIATISSQRGEYGTAMENYKKCINLLSETDNYSELAKAYAGIGVTYYELSEFDKVIESNEKCIELATRSGNIRIKGYGLSNAAEAYARKSDLDKATNYTNRALEIFTKLDEKPMIALAWMNHGIINRQKQAWDTSRDFFEKSLRLLRNLNVPYYLADCSRQFGLMLSEQGTSETLQESRKYLKEALDIYQNLGAVKYINVVRTELDEIK
jgi:predicted ATPase